MMLLNRPTFTHSGRLLVSGGVVYLNATQNGQQLSINDSDPVMVSIPTDNYIPMDFFDGSFDNQGGFGWDESEDDTVFIILMVMDRILHFLKISSALTLK